MNEKAKKSAAINRNLSFEAVDDMIQKHLDEIRSQENRDECSRGHQPKVGSKALGLLLVAASIFTSVSAQTEIGWQGGTVYDFGEVKQQKGTVGHTFVFRNNGNEPFSVTKIRTSCGCTTATSTGKRIAPADTAHVTVCFNPTNVEGFFHQRIVVYTDSPARQNSLFIKGTVKPRKKKPSAT